MIDKLTDEQKSVMLARLNPEFRISTVGNEYELRIGDQYVVMLRKPFFLYEQRWMWVAWRVLNWAWTSPISRAYMEWRISRPETPETMPPTEAQRLWLDKILSLAIGAGLTAVPQEEQ